MKNRFKKIAFLSILALGVVATRAGAEVSTSTTEAKTNTLLYISPSDYDHQVHLLHPYYDYWFAQGPLVEPIALKALQKNTADIGLCKANEKASTIIRIKPSLFYNPQLRVYHSRLVATVYSGGGNLLGSYMGEAQQLGYTSVDNGTQLHLKKVYQLAMQDLMTKLKVNALPENAVPENNLPCAMVGAHQEPKVSFY